jgi:hypothetical protein
VMTSPKIVGISFQGDTLQPGLDTFVTQLVTATAYWSGATAEYGVGPLSAAPPQHLNEPAGALQERHGRVTLLDPERSGGRDDGVDRAGRQLIRRRGRLRCGRSASGVP